MRFLNTFESVLQKSQLQIDNLFIDIKRLKNQYKYQSKLRYYRNLFAHSSCISFDQYYESVTFPVGELKGGSCFVYSDNEQISHIKKSILQKLIILSEKLIDDYENTELKIAFKKLEDDLRSYLSWEEELFFQDGGFVFPEAQIINYKLKQTHKRLRYILKKSFRKVLRDIRQYYRALVKLLFKNMDDEAASEKNMIFFLKGQLFFISNNQLYEYSFRINKKIK